MIKMSLVRGAGRRVRSRSEDAPGLALPSGASTHSQTVNREPYLRSCRPPAAPERLTGLSR